MKTPKPYTELMKARISLLVNKGYHYYNHTPDGEVVISIRNDNLSNGNKTWAINFLDYDCYSFTWESAIDPTTILKEFYQAFKFQRKLDLAWRKKSQEKING